MKPTIMSSKNTSGLIFMGRTSEPTELPFGVYIGSTEIYRMPFMLDFKRLTNPHMCIIGTSGSGKSFFVKSLLLRYSLQFGYSLIIFDWNGEYDDIVKFIGGKIIAPLKWTEEISSLFSTQRSVISINLKRLQNDKVRRLAAHKILNSLSDTMHSLKPDGTTKLILIIDEAWRLLDNTYHIGQLFREARKYGISIIVATQLLSDFGPEILFNSAAIAVFKTSNPSDIKTLLSMGIITEADAVKIRELQVGRCMLYLSEKETHEASKKFYVKKIDGMPIKGFTLRVKYMKKYIDYAHAMRTLEEIGITKTNVLKVSEILDQMTDEIELDVFLSKLISIDLKRDEIITFLRMLGFADLPIVTAYELALQKRDVYATEKQE